MKVATTAFAIEFVPCVLKYHEKADGASPKQDPLGGGIVPLDGRVGVEDVEDGVEDEGEN